MLMDMTDARLVMAHEGGYSEVHVPFCGHAVLEQLSGSSVTATDPLKARIDGQQPDRSLDQLQEKRIDHIAALHKL